jgi:hypothetical protein
MATVTQPRPAVSGHSAASTEEEFIRQTIHLWQRRTSRSVNGEDARQITENISGFFSTLIAWQARDQEGDESSPRQSKVA